MNFFSSTVQKIDKSLTSDFILFALELCFIHYSGIKQCFLFICVMLSFHVMLSGIPILRSILNQMMLLVMPIDVVTYFFKSWHKIKDICNSM